MLSVKDQAVRQRGTQDIFNKKKKMVMEKTSSNKKKKLSEKIENSQAQ